MFNPLQFLLRRAIENGVPANIMVLILLFPVIASIIAISRHVIGLSGFGIYTPAVLSVALVSTGILDGVLIFVAVLLAATFTRKLIKKLKLPLLPRTAMLLWGVSVVILFLLIGVSFLSKYSSFSSLLTINIFPILIMILLTENFMESQLFKSQKEALKITYQTIFIAVLCAFLMSQEIVQQFVILRPEMTLIMVALINWVTGKYTGLRLLEYLRFKSLLQE